MPDHADDWKDRAACRDLDTDLWFGTPDRYGVDRHDPARLALAKSVCHGCPVREECLAAGSGEQGVWGETTSEERECLVRRIPRKKCPVCAATELVAAAGMQVCVGCGHSWLTARPQGRAKTDAA